ncbi:MAG: type III-B CRISPR module RAMP protein Cmr6 [Amphritea sp.]
MVPLYKECDITGASQLQQFATAHKGLWFERFFNQYGTDFSIDNKTGKTAFLDTLSGTHQQQGHCGDESALEVHCLRQRALIEARQGQTMARQTSWHFAGGLGNPHPVENSLLWHPTLGVPYLPASSIKGLLRAWLELHDLPSSAMQQLFGSENKDPAKQSTDQVAGELIFFDALPVKRVTLVVDTMTPHMGKWYEQGASAPGRGDTLPADWHDPVPVTFLVAKNMLLQFSIAPRKSTPDAEEKVSFAMKALSDALLHLGAGAKTAAGYGHMQTPDATAQNYLNRLDREIKDAKAEAEQKAADAALTDSQLRLKKLKEAAENSANHPANTEYHRDLAAAVKEAPDWPTEDQQTLGQFARQFFKQYGSKKRIKEMKPLISALLGEG